MKSFQCMFWNVAPESNLVYIYLQDRKVVLGICAMAKKSCSKPMKEIIQRLVDNFERLQVEFVVVVVGFVYIWQLEAFGSFFFMPYLLSVLLHVVGSSIICDQSKAFEWQQRQCLIWQLVIHCWHASVRVGEP